MTINKQTHIAYKKIGSFKDVIKNITYKARFIGYDNKKQPILDNTIKLPTIVFTGTVKIHGTNASVCWQSTTNKIWYQSRKQIKRQGHYNFVKHMSNVDFGEIYKKVYDQLSSKHRRCIVTIFGEWGGKNIHNCNVGIEKLPRKFYIFGIKITASEGPYFNSFYMHDDFVKSIQHKDDRVDNIFNYKNFKHAIDFNNSDTFFKIKELTEEVEKECPVAGGIGEGIVWKGKYKGDEFMFKEKGDLHSQRNPKVIKPFDHIEHKCCKDFALTYVNKNRIYQALFENDLTINSASKKHTGIIIKWVYEDIISEEGTEILISKLNEKMLKVELGKLTRELFFDMLDSYD